MKWVLEEKKKKKEVMQSLCLLALGLENNSEVFLK